MTKLSIFAMGVNLQSCARMIFSDATHSFEGVYQGVRRIWRFGQTREVHVYMVLSSASMSVLRNYKRKEIENDRSMEKMIEHMAIYNDLSADEMLRRDFVEYNPTRKMEIPSWLFSKS